MRLLVGVVGRAGSGKTTFVEAGAEACPDSVYAVYPGRACRERFGMAAFAEADDPAAPEFSEEFVREFVRGAARSGARIVLVDGMPKTPEQVEFFKDLADKTDRTPLVVLVESSAGVTALRMKARDKTEDEAALSERRLISDALLVQVIEAKCREADVESCRVQNHGPPLAEWREFAADLVAGLESDARYGDEGLSEFRAIAGAPTRHA